MNPAVCAMHSQLQTAFKAVEELFENWSALEAEIRVCMKRMEDLSEQLQLMPKADLSKSKIPQLFPEALNRVMAMVEEELDSCLEDVTHALVEEEMIVSEIHEHYHKALERCTSTEEVEYGDPGEWPPIPTMLQALSKIYRICYSVYHQRKYHTESLDYRDEEKVSRMVRSWNEHRELTNTMEDTLSKLAYHQRASFQSS